MSTYDVEDDAELQCQWDPLTPFAGARLNQGVEICVAERGYVYWSDAFMNGRQALGERWMFTALAHELNSGVPACWSTWSGTASHPASGRSHAHGWPAARPISGPSWRADATSSPKPLSVCMPICRRVMVCAAADVLDRRLLLVRLMADAGVPFHEARACCLALLEE